MRFQFETHLSCVKNYAFQLNEIPQSSNQSVSQTTDNTSVIRTSGPKMYTFHGTTFFRNISLITPHSCKLIQCNEGTDKANPVKTRTSSHTSNIHKIEKV